MLGLTFTSVMRMSSKEQKQKCLSASLVEMQLTFLADQLCELKLAS